VYQCAVQPHLALSALDDARRRVEEPYPHYYVEEEAESALNQIDLLAKEAELVIKTYPAIDLRGRDTDGKPSNIVTSYVESGFTPLDSSNPRLPMESMKEEMLAVRLLAAIELCDASVRGGIGSLGRVVEAPLDRQAEATKLLNDILSTIAQPPLNLFPASGSGERIPPITIHLLAFYFRVCLTDKALKEFGVQEFCDRVTGDWLSDETVYCLATHGFVEVETAHDPRMGHATRFRHSGASGCMPCTFRLLRSGHSEWEDGLQQAVHFGRVEWVAFALNRLLSGVDGRSVLDVLIEPDPDGCNTLVHAANDKYSGFAGLTVRLLAQAVSFSEPDIAKKPGSIRKMLNSGRRGSTSSMDCIGVENMVALAAFVDLGARLWNSKGESKRWVLEQIIEENGLERDENAMNLIRAIETRSNELVPCSYCGKPPTRAKDKLLYCSRCNRSRYCGKSCQKKAYKTHKYVCTTAKVEESTSFYAANISAPRP